jgi:hypothetical protein
MITSCPDRSTKRLIQGECVPTSRTTRLDSKPFIVRPIADIVVATVKVSTVIDDWGLAPVHDVERRDLLKIMENRYDLRSTIWTSQLPIAKWHDHVADPTIADAICDRLLHNANRIELHGPSRRKVKTTGD